MASCFHQVYCGKLKGSLFAGWVTDGFQNAGINGGFNECLFPSASPMDSFLSSVSLNLMRKRYNCWCAVKEAGRGGADIEQKRPQWQQWD